MMYGYGYGGSAMWGIGWGGLLGALFCLLLIGALVKYLFFDRRR
ncbi:MAG TPA: hypothetical protein PLO16_15615 [Acidocella sp.]|nr:hypothetical protein [Acidocella sp.]HQT65927.1 hypothetical protein [Acidocella sp.]